MIGEGGTKIFLIPEIRSELFPSSGKEEWRIRSAHLLTPFEERNAHLNPLSARLRQLRVGRIKSCRSSDTSFWAHPSIFLINPSPIPTNLQSTLI